MEDGKKSCDMPSLDAGKLQEAFVRVVNQLLVDKDTLIVGMLVERIKVINLVQVEFVLQSGVRIVETV